MRCFWNANWGEYDHFLQISTSNLIHKGLKWPPKLDRVIFFGIICIPEISRFACIILWVEKNNSVKVLGVYLAFYGSNLSSKFAKIKIKCPSICIPQTFQYAFIDLTDRYNGNLTVKVMFENSTRVQGHFWEFENHRVTIEKPLNYKVTNENSLSSTC